MTSIEPALSSNDFQDYLLHLGDNALIMGHRNSEWTGHGPVLEQDIALSNIALDLVGQARHFYQYAAAIKGGESTEDTLAYLRDAGEFRNCLLAELDNGDWAKTVLRQFFFSAYQFYLFEALTGSKDLTIAAIAEKSLKEVNYHLRWSGEWVIRLGDGTAESHDRVNNALSALWMYTGELTRPADYESRLAEAGIAVNPALIKQRWMVRVSEVLELAFLNIPVNAWMQSGGKQGRHTEHLGYILVEMQYLQRAYPGCTW